MVHGERGYVDIDVCEDCAVKLIAGAGAAFREMERLEKERERTTPQGIEVVSSLPLDK